MCIAPGMLCPEGAVGLSPGFQPWEPTPKRRALKGRQIERTNHTNAGCRCNMSIARSSRPFRAKRFIDWFPGLKPWAESSSPFGAGLWAIWPTLNTYQGLPWVNFLPELALKGPLDTARMGSEPLNGSRAHF
jgi:hypothetical protein